MNLLARLLASGVFVALMPLGLVIARALLTHRARDVLALALPLALAAMSVPLGAAAVLGHFDARWNGGLGWLLSIAAVLLLADVRSRAFLACLRTAVARHPGVLWILALAAIVYSLAVVETPIGARDEGLHTLAALALERAGNVLVATPDAVARASGLFEPFLSGIRFYLPGIPAAESLKPQFSPLLPAWIAQLHAMGGDALLYRFNVLTAVACGGVFYALARRALRRPVALLALAVFAINPAQVWIARINLAEPLGALFALGGLLAALDAVRAGGKARTCTAVGLLALAAFVRVDMIIIAPLFTAAAIACAWFTRDHVRAARLLHLSVCVLAAQSAAIALLWTWSPSYVIDHLRFLLLAPAAGAIGVATYGLTRASRVDAAMEAGLRRRLAMAACVAIALLFAYASLARPYVEPYAVIPDRGSALAGARDFREESLWNLAAYLGWPCVVLALCGALSVLWRAGHARGTAASVIIAALAVGSGIVYLATPTVSPDHPWAIRRMLTLVVPLVVLVAGMGVQSMLHAALAWRAGRWPLAALVVLAAWMIVVQRSTLVFTENAGLTAQLRTVDAALPAGPLVVRGFEGLATTFALGFGRQVLPLRDEAVAVDAASRAFWSSCNARPCTLLHASFDGLNGLVLAEPSTLQLSREYLEPVLRPLARTRRRETLHLLASRVAGIAEDPPPSNAGAARDWRLEDHGFYRDELAPGIAVRWTNGDAQLTLPPAKADRLELHVASASPVAQPLRIEVDGVPVFEGSLWPGESRWRFPLRTPAEGHHRLTLRSATFIPGDYADGRDRRSLGVSVRAVRLLDGEAPRLSAQSPATDFRSQLTLRPTALNPLDETRSPLAYRVDVDNRGAAAWPAATEDAGAAGTVALGTYWTRAGDAHRQVEDRVPLPYSLAPGEHWTTPIIVKFDSEPLRRWPPGDYELHVGLVLEGVNWFADRGDAALTIPITIPRR